MTYRRGWPVVLVFLLASVGSTWARKAPVRRLGYDLDNTLFDTRYRTQAAVRDFAKGSRSPDLRRALKRAERVANIDFDGESTARRLGMSQAHVAAFAQHWNRFFWTPKNIAFDRPVSKLVARAKAAARQGSETFYISGRTARATAATLRQLLASGLPNADRAHLVLKPNIEHKTLPFKLAAIRRLRIDRYTTDSLRETEALSAVGLRGSWVDFPVHASTAVSEAGGRWALSR